MELRYLATFRTLAATLNFTQTAALLGYVQSSVSAQIQELEAELGVALFESCDFCSPKTGVQRAAFERSISSRNGCTNAAGWVWNRISLEKSTFYLVYSV